MSAVDQFLAAARDGPRTYRTRLQWMLYSGPTPRKDAEAMERARWIEVLATLLRDRWEICLSRNRKQPNYQEQVAGRPRSGVRLARRYLADQFRKIAVPTRLEHMVDYFKVRASEPCTTGTLKNTHRSFTSLKEVAGTPKSECVTENPLYQVLYHELLSKAAPGRPTKQALRMLVAMLRSIGQLIMREGEMVDLAAKLGHLAIR